MDSDYINDLSLNKANLIHSLVISINNFAQRRDKLLRTQLPIQ